MTLELPSPCKVNLLLNILGRRPDGFHELETVLQPVPVFDRLSFERKGSGFQLTCSDPALPVDDSNLVYRAARAFFSASGILDGVNIHLDKRLPLAAGLGGGSSNAAVTLLGLNTVFDRPLTSERLNVVAAGLGSDVPFFLQPNPALGTGRGDRVQPLAPFRALSGKALLLFRPGFGVSTPWAYKQLAAIPAAVNGTPGRAQQLIALLDRTDDAAFVGNTFYNALEAPVFSKYPLLADLKEWLLTEGALAALMSGSGSTMVAIIDTKPRAQALVEKLRSRHGDGNWVVVATL